MTTKQFWQALQADEQTICQHPLYKMVELINQILHASFPKLNIDIIAGQAKPYALMISAQDDVNLFEEVVNLWRSAVPLQHFEILPFRQPSQLLDKLEMTVDNQHIALTNQHILVALSQQQRRIALKVAIDTSIPATMTKHARALTVMLLSHSLGEYEFATRVNQLTFVDPSAIPTAIKLIDLPTAFQQFWQNTLGHTGQYPSQEWQWTNADIAYQHDEVSDVALLSRNESANSLVTSLDYCYRLELAARVDNSATMQQVSELEQQINNMLLDSQQAIFCQALYTDAIRYMTWYVKHPQQAFELADKQRQTFATLDTELITLFDPSWEDYLHWVSD